MFVYAKRGRDHLIKIFTENLLKRAWILVSVKDFHQPRFRVNPKRQERRLRNQSKEARMAKNLDRRQRNLEIKIRKPEGKSINQ